MAASKQYSSTNEGCRARIPLFPLRYSAHSRPKGGIDYGYDRPTLENGFPGLKHAQYGLRFIGGGFIYLLDETEGDVFVWGIKEDDGQFLELLSKHSTLEASLKGYKTGNALPQIWARSCSRVHLLLTDTLLTARKVRELQANREGIRDRLCTTIDMKSWKPEAPTKNTFPAEYLQSQVEELKGTPLDFSPWNTVPSRSASAVLTGMKGISSEAQIAIVMYDHIGLVQDLTGLVQQACGAMEKYCATPEEGDSQEHVGRHRKKIVADLIEKIYESSYAAKKGLQSQEEISKSIEREAEIQDWQIRRIREQSEQLRQIQQISQRRVNGRSQSPLPPLPNRRETRSKVLMNVAKLNARHVRENERIDFLNKYEKDLQHLHKKSLGHKNDRCIWLRTYFSTTCNELGSSFLRYDKFDNTSSSSHASAFCSCIEGMVWGTEETPDGIKDEERDLFGFWWQASGDKNPHLINLELDKGLAEELWKSKGDALVATVKELRAIPLHYATNALIRQIGVFALTRPNAWRGAVRNNVDELIHRLAGTGTVGDAARLRNILEERYRDHIRTRQLSRVEAERFIRQAAGAPAFTTEGSIARGAGNTMIVLDWERMSALARYANPFMQTLEMGAASVVGVLSILNLKAAIMGFDWKPGARGASASSVGAAIMGLASAISGMLASTEIAMPAAYGRISSASRVATWIASRAATRAFGYGGAIFDAMTNAFKAHAQYEIGNSDAASYYSAASFFVGSGGAAITFGSTALMGQGITLATVALGVPVWGWLVAGVIFLGIGVWFMMRGDAARYDAIAYWLNDGTFGNRELLGRPSAREFETLDKESYWYMVACYSPKLIDLDWSSMSLSLSLYDPRLEIEIHYPLPGEILPPMVEFDKEVFKTTHIEMTPHASESGSERRSYTIRGLEEKDRETFGVRFAYTPKNIAETLVATVRPGSSSSIEPQAEDSHR
ncbi:toxin VasX [Pseudomonas protegens]|uniref:toxin VasX n=1 Tax=Pseudomonas protegens TaxID=380021 RepID=UPI00283AA9FD|nr:toxin VasX [Pseudomonas protegens]